MEKMIGNFKEDGRLPEGFLASLEKLQVVAMCGVSGSGKTYLSKLLEIFGFKRISSDEIIWDRYGDSFPDMPDYQKMEIFQSSWKILTESLCRSLEEGSRVVVDATMCKLSKRNEIRSICRKHYASLGFIYMEVPFETLEKRLEGRKGLGANDQIVGSRQLEEYFSNFERPSGECDVSRIYQ